MKNLATTTNGANDPADWKVTLLVLLFVGCGLIAYHNYDTALANFSTEQINFLLVAAALIVAGCAILRGAWLIWYANQPVQENALVLRDDLFAFRDKDSGLWGLISSTDGIIAEAQFEYILPSSPWQDADHIKVKVNGGHTNVFSIDQQKTLLPGEYSWIRHLSGSCHVVTTLTGDTKKQGLYCTARKALVVPIEFSNFKMVKEGHAVFFEDNPHPDRFDNHFYGLYSLEQQAVVVPTKLEYHRVETRPEGGFYLKKVVGHTGSRMRLLYPVWQDDVYNLERGLVEVYESARPWRPYNRDYNTVQEATEEGVLCTFMGVRFLYPEGSMTQEVYR